MTQSGQVPQSHTDGANMQLTGIGNGQLVPRSRTSRAVPVTAASSGAVQAARSEEALRLLTRLQDTVAQMARGRPVVAIGRRIAGPAAAISSAPIGLRTTPTAAVLGSSGAVTTVTTSFTPANPSWAGVSTAAPTVGGLYDGSQGTDTLTVTVTRANAAGAGRRDLEIRTSAGALVDTVALPGSALPGTVYPLANGLTLSFGAGPMFRNDTFTVGVSVSPPVTVDPDAAFDGGAGPAMNFGGGRSVTAGSFTVNGVAIAVNATDSVSSVLARVTASAAGVDAVFDAPTGRVVMTQRTLGSTPTVVLGSDTSGFLAAMHLDDATVQPGTDDELDGAVLRDVAALASVTSGTLQVNGRGIGVDVAADTLGAVLSRIESESSGIRARYASDRVTIDAPQVLRLRDGGTGFFAALHIDTGEYGGRAVSRSGISSGARREVNASLRRLTDDLNALLSMGDDAPAFVRSFRLAVVDVMGDVGQEGLHRLGLQFSADSGAGGLRFDETGARWLERHLRDDPAAALGLLFGGGGSTGLVARLEANVTASISIATRASSSA